VGHLDLNQASVVLVGHGSTVNAQSADPVYQHAAELRARKSFAEIHESFWKQEPRVQDVVAARKTSHVFVLPLFISEGYFSEQILPRELGFQIHNGRLERVRHSGAQAFIYCKPVGTHNRMTQVLLARASGVVKQFPFPRMPQPSHTTLFVAGHGTEQDANSRQAIETQVRLIRAMNRYADVQSVFIEEKPHIAECYQLAKTRNFILVPFFISNGMHVVEDIPVMLGEAEQTVKRRLTNGQPTWRNPTERKGKLVWCSSSVGTDPGIADVIIERVQEAASAFGLSLPAPN
jgi:sirohydrochlorin cobaltochelatase